MAGYILLASLSLLFSFLSLSLTLIYTKISDESPSSHHHSGTQKPVPQSHIHIGTPPQCCSVRTHTVQEKMKTYSTNRSAVKNGISFHFISGKDQQKHGFQFVLIPRKHNCKQILNPSCLLPASSPNDELIPKNIINLPGVKLHSLQETY